jgi:glycine cleavage system H lipoate-binding protein
MATAQPQSSLKVVPPDKKKCIWMEAGVVSYKLCYNNYDCSTCDYDHAMQLKVSQQREAAVGEPQVMEGGADKFSATWVDKMMKLQASRRKCRYMLTGEVNRKICPNAYECGNCSFDQMMQERLQTQTLPVGILEESSGFKLAGECYYHEGHVWARPEYGGRIRVGMDDFAQRLLGKVSEIVLPEVGQEVQKGKSAFQLKRNGEKVFALSPMDGIVTHLNHQLLNRPDLINASPFEEGWLFIIEPTRLKKNLKDLYFGEEAKKYLAEERDRLMEKAGEELRVSADGGQSVDDIFSQLKGEKWSKLVKTFLRS